MSGEYIIFVPGYEGTQKQNSANTKKGHPSVDEWPLSL